MEIVTKFAPFALFYIMLGIGMNTNIENIINMTDNKVIESMRGVNASSIADISSISRSTVIRKLNKLSKEKIIKRNKKLEYFLTGQKNK